MATISRPSRTTDARSGGKIDRRRQSTSLKTPYDRPSQPPPPPPKSPTWLAGLVFPATRMLATGAGKLLSSVFTVDSSSSSSASSSDCDFGSDDNIDDANEVSSDEIRELNEKHGKLAEMDKAVIEKLGLSIGNNETKGVIESLILQETFSREECNRLTKIINSRVRDFSAVNEEPDVRLSEIPSRTVDSDTSNIYSKAVMEAKKWLEEKKVGSSPKSDLRHGLASYNLPVLQQVAQSNAGSPVDMAKSYMRSRPPWASPSMKHIELSTPSPLGTELFGEGTSMSAGVGSSSLSRKRDSLASGPWNIQEEIRRVRSKATVDMLRDLPSTRIDLSTVALEPKAAQVLTVAGKVTSVNDKRNMSNSLPATKYMDASKNIVSDLSPCGEFPDLFAVAVTVAVLRRCRRCSSPLSFVISLSSDEKPNDENCSATEAADEFRDTSNANALPSSQSSLSAGSDPEQNLKQTDVANPDLATSHNNELNNRYLAEQNCELLSEFSLEVPVGNELNSTAGGSQNNSSMGDFEELSQEPSLPNLDASLAGKTGSIVVKQQGKKQSRPSRRTRGRVK